MQDFASNQTYTFTQKAKMLCYMLIGIGLVTIIASFATGYHQTWANLLMNNFFFMAIALGGTFFLSVQYTASVGWSALIKRVLEAMGRHLLLAGIFMVIIFFAGGHHLYHWLHEDLYDPASEHFDPIIAGKSGFLNLPFFTIRMILYFVIWVGFTYLLRKNSLAMDNGGDPVALYRKNVRHATAFLVLFAITSSTSAWDFVMSIDTHWFSTLFGWYTFAGIFVSALSVLAMLLMHLKGRGYLPEVNENHLNDIGKFMFAFSIFWTYLWFAQFMLIWYANLPEEVIYFMTRFTHYKVLFIGTFFINFICPLLLLMTRDAKRQLNMLGIVGVILFIGHWIDVFVMIIPGTMYDDWHLGWHEIGTACFFGGIFLFTTLNALSKAPLVVRNHPMMRESLQHHI